MCRRFDPGPVHSASGTAGVVSEVRFAVGDRVDMGDLLVVLDTGESS